MSRFTVKIAERMAADCGLPCTGRKLLPVLQTAEAAHDAAVAQMEEVRDRPLQNARGVRDEVFVNAARDLWHAWQAMDADGRARLAWSAAYGGKSNPATVWLREAIVESAPTAQAPYGVGYENVEQRIELMIVALGTLPITTPHLDAKRGRKKQLAGLEAAHEAFRRAPRDMWNKEWQPKYDRADTAAEPFAGARVSVGAEGKLFLSFAQQLDTSYTAENCYSASGGRGEGKSTK